jgi:hypothetical protein
VGDAEGLVMTNSQSDQTKDDLKANSTKPELSPNLLARKKATRAAAAVPRDKARVDVLIVPR